MKRVTEEFILAHPECRDVQRPLDLLPLLVDDEEVVSLADTLLFTAQVEREYQVLVRYRFTLLVEDRDVTPAPIL